MNQNQPAYQRDQAKQNNVRTLEQFTPMINKYAFKFHRRASGLGCALDLDDIRQELSIVFLRCVDAYDEAKGASFLNFTITSMYHEMNKLMARDQRNIELFTTVRDHQVDEDGDSYGESIFDRVDSGWATPEQNMEAAQCYHELMESLSEPARLLVENVVNPSPEILHQFDLQARGAAQLRQQGIAARASHHLNLSFLFNLFGLSRDTGNKLKLEVRRKAQRAFVLEGQ